MSITIQSIPSSNKVTVGQSAEYSVSVQASTSTTTYRVQYHLYNITDTKDATFKSALDTLGNTVKIDFLEDAKRELSNTFPVGQTQNGFQDTQAAKTFSPFWACLETDLETCETTETNNISSPEFRLLNCNEDLDLSQTQVLSKRPLSISKCRDSQMWLPVWVIGGGFFQLKVNGSPLGSVPISSAALGSVHYLDFTRFVGSDTTNLSYTINGQEYVANIDGCCTGNTEIANLTSCGVWEFMDFNHARSFSIDTTGSQAIQNKIKLFCEKTATGKYSLVKCLDLDWQNVEWIESWLNSRYTKIKLNGVWQDAIIEDGSFEVFEEENQILLTIVVSKAKQLKAL